jgi:cbb3-type cytochrome oxidase maturation protein
MTEVYYLIPIALALGGIALGAFMWSLRSGQYDDLAGAAERILFNEQDVPDRIAPPPALVVKPPHK